ncbi:aminoglycoside phosphotransferase family protein [Streptomyces sp. WMMB 322]|uniref:aminoglycoside phosphotransferase family protein n=1 Tax=Streptomyces sp. WMMB 322 TaxID=1286821 RepID=UPI000823CD46|nr:aminoglycoside phosphotransferase family protein [Streptomyces sp. WMMB 322]SCK46926.1 Predicted kinase, aminoglycoside phosphotransferase (APT) family [Streptomyces sp. WMMB 322]
MSAISSPPPIDAALVRKLIASQFPRWAHLPVTPVAAGGNDNRTFRLGDAMTVRLPSAEGYAPQAEKEQTWLPVLAPRLPLPVPVPLAKGEPAEGYPFRWTVNRWIDGETASPERIGDLAEFATDLAGFLTALQAVDTAGGPLAGEHSFYRGSPLTTYDAETRRAIEALAGRGHIPAARATAVWETALNASWDGPPVWFHGDVAHGNLLVADGRLSAVIDFGCSGVGDPSCDLTIAWTLLSGESREAFREAMSAGGHVDAATWARGRGWALWKALISLAGFMGDGADSDAAAVLDAVLSEYEEERIAR